MMKRPNFKNVTVLLADSDSRLAQAVMHNLRAMGFGNVSYVKTTAEAVQVIRSKPTSFLITEWDLKGATGIELVRYMRRSPESPNRSLPIIMLTGRGELHDVQQARDMGITEFVIKPFSAQTLFSRIEQIIDHPRGFVMSSSYVGPERRRRGVPPAGVADRRVVQPINVEHSREAMKAAPGDATVVFTPDHSLRQLLGTHKPLTDFITPDILRDAQKAIDRFGEESLQWVREDLALMQQAHDSLKQMYSIPALGVLKETALSIKSRAGTFGYPMASDVSRLLFLFLTTDFQSTNPRHLLVIQKHIEVLTVILANGLKERSGLGAELYKELERLISIHR